jgi:hypothetical protein
MYICPATGHAVDPDHADGPQCVRHGVPLFSRCPKCREEWPVLSTNNYSGRPDSGAEFCGTCAEPAPWLSRAQLLEWIQNQVRASGMAGRMPRNTALELAELFRRLDTMSSNDLRSAEVWKLLRNSAPKIWEATKAVRDVLIGEAVKRMLGV